MVDTGLYLVGSRLGRGREMSKPKKVVGLMLAGVMLAMFADLYFLVLFALAVMW